MYVILVEGNIYATKHTFWPEVLLLVTRELLLITRSRRYSVNDFSVFLGMKDVRIWAYDSFPRTEECFISDFHLNSFQDMLMVGNCCGPSDLILVEPDGK